MPVDEAFTPFSVVDAVWLPRGHRAKALVYIRSHTIVLDPALVRDQAGAVRLRRGRMRAHNWLPDCYN